MSENVAAVVVRWFDRVIWGVVALLVLESVHQCLIAGTAGEALLGGVGVGTVLAVMALGFARLVSTPRTPTEVARMAVAVGGGMVVAYLFLSAAPAGMTLELFSVALVLVCSRSAVKAARRLVAIRRSA